MEKSIHTPEYAVFLRFIRQTRVEAGLTQEDVAQRLGATQTFVSKCERGERRLDLIELHAWCGALGIGTADFVEEFVKKLQRDAEAVRRALRNPRRASGKTHTRKPTRTTRG
ncbi:helix-turn-helix domain-containing protein [Paraburkholderia tropica]|uniref:helix-turn-helix domain-containing protein n=1 Tax=Paraburkholderia tropica TaxID=92647 RepID=UPI002AB72A67|nr:helix-turn-helix transcriptional regulator [Paraburkholderia tropica]